MTQNSLNDRWRGRRYICLVRQSNDSEGTASTEAQLHWLRHEGERRGMIFVDQIILNGVTGSLPGKRQDLDDLLQRKRENDDFDVLLVQRLDRLTRGGSKHGSWFEYECDRIGIELLCLEDDLPEDAQYGSVIKTLKYQMAQEQARSIGQRSVQGAMHSIEQGRNSVISRTPYACDRLVESIYENPIYCGVGLGQHISQGIYYRRGDDTPEPVQLDAQTLANCRSAPRKLRPPDEWIWQPQPRMGGFLPAALAEKALVEIKKLLIERWERSQGPTQPKRSTSKHKASAYILTGLLIAKQDGQTLAGTLGGKKDKPVRKYRHRKGRKGYPRGSVFNRVIDAASFEQACLDLVIACTADMPDLRDQIIAAVEALAPTAKSMQRAQREAIAKRVKAIFKPLTPKPSRMPNRSPMA